MPNNRAARLPRVLVVEDRADRPVGHWPVLFVDVAASFAAIGSQVSALTARGWYFAGERSLPFPVHRYGPVARTFDRVADLLQHNRRARRMRGWLRRMGEVLRVAVIVRAAATRAHAEEDDTIVIVLSNVDAPEFIGVFAGRGRWLSYVSFSPRRVGAWGRRVGRVAATVERVRRARGGASVVGAPSGALREEWARAWPAADVRLVSLPYPGDACSIADARAQLGIDPSLRLALLFGMRHPEKDPDTVFAAFSELDTWHLVVGGTLADHPPPSARLFRRYPGYVADATRALLFAAADLVVISCHPGFMRASWNLHDAIRWSVPVVCSDQSLPAEIVRTHRLGTVFEAGNAGSLARAVRAAPVAIDPADLARVRGGSLKAAEEALRALGVPVRSQGQFSNAAPGLAGAVDPRRAWGWPSS